ncbi:methyl-accepting chemotaxis protein [Paraburkholderia caballeronis]|uniref:methyl-accepting chemotaxis protein n=1 Tax=Paraburkholderia caballeronis TaxID=416943 RepID=UPI001066AEED|nr:methyl-accepting chemotaxis protein [Paraburkholderia caballeronis]TDV16419.1 methyl-accepting chemotaxis sensory transducer with TarH sensor [Paraburkholderia caballeronis]TDV18815.1 methyl-accepting chemotaxis sensory transducer with TarH sensor [Paraburkholderia caballeronis]TDV26948.1 methyl-accepting chemotaxis sensory transducer with TarH sensor [Paraburkholderia caballeronis]
MFSRLSISVRLWATIALLGLLIFATGLLGQFGMQRSNAALGYAYSNQLAAALNIGKANLNLTIVRTTLDRVLLHPDSPDVPNLIKKALDYRDVSENAWRAYAALPHSDDERALADSVSAARAAMLTQGIQPMVDALKQGDHQTADTIAMTTLPPLSVALTKSSAALETWQHTHGQQVFDEAERLFGWLRIGGIALIVFGLVICVGCSYGLHRSIAAPLAYVLAALQRISAGDLTVSLQTRSRDEMGRLIEGLKTMQQELAQTVRQVTRSSESIAAATRQIAAGNGDLSQRTEEQAASLQQTAASMEELTATVKHNADSARTAQTLADNAHDVVARSARVVGDAVQTMDQIDQSSQKIADITGVIEGIAFQTNILALNAAVEAARAGDQGRGFAVVAGEVRSLAQRAGTAAKEIKELIGESVERVATGTKFVRSAGDTMGEIRQSIGQVATIMKEIAHASDEQRDGIEQVSRAVSQMDEVSQQNAALVEQAAAAAASLDDQAGALRDAVSVFRLA